MHTGRDHSVIKHQQITDSEVNDVRKYGGLYYAVTLYF